MRLALTGGQPTPLAVNQSDPAGLTVDASNVYWVNSISDTVMSVPIAGGTPVTIAAETKERTRVARIYAIAVDSTSVYWTSGSNAGFGAVEKAPIGGGTPVTLATGWEMASMTSDPNALSHAISQSPSMGIAVDATAIYWTNVGAGRSGTVMTVGLAGGTATTLASDQDGPTAIVVDAGNIYWANRSAVMRLSK
jgi:hypothetical protein